jgi:hypothetical protein
MRKVETGMAVVLETAPMRNKGPEVEAVVKAAPMWRYCVDFMMKNKVSSGYSPFA